MNKKDMKVGKHYWVNVGRKVFRVRCDAFVPGGILVSEAVLIRRYKEDGSIEEEEDRRTITVSGGQVHSEALITEEFAEGG